MNYKGYEIERVVEYTFSDGETLVLYHVKKDGEYIKKNILTELKCKIIISTLEERA